MIKYIQSIINEFKSRIAGMKANPEKWTNQEVTVTIVEGYIKDLEDQSETIEAAESALQKARDAGHKLEESLLVKLKQVDNLAYGIHATETVKLGDYGLSVRKAGSSKPVPGKCMISSIVDDADGEGFVVSWGTIAEADHYEIEKGVAAAITDMVLAPPYPFLKSTSKTTVTDDDIEKGRRYFFRVRAVNAAGSGEWSEPVNRVQ
jgi:Asp-tRNA(Asn)/Glu-tRNA(Gln) amidotransferase A subunit family amidase